MAQLTPFAYQLPPAALHRRDPRLKLAALLAFSVTTMTAGTPGLVITALLLSVGYRYAGLPLIRTTVGLRLLWLIALVVALSRSITVSDPGGPHISGAALLTGAGYGVRLLGVALLGNLFVATTSRGRIIDTLAWACTPLPAHVRRQLPLAVAVALSTYPLIARSMRRVREACIVRGAWPRRNPWLTINVVARGAVDNVPLRITRIADAITVRGFSNTPSPPRFTPDRLDARLAVLLAAAVLLALTTAAAGL
ncbi:MAG: energy-coupling factor transporter transmembrane protein EcfT [Spirochaetaceae bacterium]|nr:MAG: energy-coupling factor transporter transmembrane protein EcfT [Spirochaetaceae bacterium]